ncbi:MAG TPA: hypothetical protein VK636_18660, partial [Gemmatimonadaceae bacterium]|nr:hypothetical protein [Gemmatimonadaceae bacterium]
MKACSTNACAVWLAAVALGSAACSKETHRDTTPTDSAIAPSERSPTPEGVSAGVGTYIGLRHDPLPDGVQPEGGAVLTGALSNYAFTHVHTPRGDMIWLDSIADGRGAKNKTVRAALTIPLLSNDERLFMASCDVNARLDARVVAIVVNEPGATKFTKIRQAWRVN